MFDALMKSSNRKFSSKCKSVTKVTKTRLEAIKRKRQAMEKHLKEDIAKLLQKDHDYNAYGRVEDYMNELNLTSCYEMVEQFCSCISDNISVMRKEKECPVECREAVACLMFAAARFADLPELRDIRTIFAERYGSSVEPFINKEFANKFKSKPPTKDMKFQLLQKIAQESSIDWNPKALEQKLYVPLPSNKDSLKKYEFQDDKCSADFRFPNIRDQADIKANHANDREQTPSTRNEEPMNKNNCKLPTSRPDVEGGRSSVRNLPETNSAGTSYDQGIDNRPTYSRLAPPYFKPGVGKHDTSLEAQAGSPVGNETIMLQKKDLEQEAESPKPESPAGREKPKPRSVRKNFLKTIQGQDNVGKGSGTVKNNSNAMVDEDEEEKLDRLLSRYIGKPSSNVAGVTAKGSQKTLPSAKVNGNERPEFSRARTHSLPPKSPTLTDTTRGHTRAASFQQNMFNNDAPHPKLPDYDEFIARLAALRGR
ncbi:Vacuolar protein sorting-associated protein Ist1 [Dillenia turbinata]|uniref:Vacuolar protein sorting-associated protein Ist1 n=1 Tax=Dillenia turbinata TaxID=194707 RepID=A0AAN8UAU3_9MAGN